MSSTPAYATPGALTAPATTNFFVAAVILALFVLSAAFSAERKGITAGFDEVAHASYVAQIQHTGDAWPDLKAMRLIDPQNFQFTGEANYLNHPPPFYDLHAALGPRLEGRPQALLAHRLIDIAIASLGFAALLGLGLAARSRVMNSTPSPYRWRAFRCWCRSPAPSTTTIWRFSAALWRCWALGS